jgi:hypothetical protein
MSSEAASDMRLAASLALGLCANFKTLDYQPKPGGIDRLERKI